MSDKKNDPASALIVALCADGTIFLSPRQHEKLICWTGAHKLRVKIEVLPAESKDDALCVSVGQALTVGL